jgi:hypothetical protein
MERTARPPIDRLILVGCSMEEGPNGLETRVETRLSDEHV